MELFGAAIFADFLYIILHAVSIANTLLHVPERMYTTFKTEEKEINSLYIAKDTLRITFHAESPYVCNACFAICVIPLGAFKF
jgi:hypothetical protein